MYKIEFLSISKNDIDNIVYYVSNVLKNNSAAKKFRENLIKATDDILQFPYGFSVYKPNKSLKYQYRSIKVNNFIMFYTIDEDKKIITVVRVLYQKMDFANILE